jgi:hypothetical protein
MHWLELRTSPLAPLKAHQTSYWGTGAKKSPLGRAPPNLFLCWHANTIHPAPLGRNQSGGRLAGAPAEAQNVGERALLAEHWQYNLQNHFISLQTSSTSPSSSPASQPNPANLPNQERPRRPHRAPCHCAVADAPPKKKGKTEKE